MPRPPQPKAPKNGWALYEQPECRHTPHPRAYLDHAVWMEEKDKTHWQMRCPICGLWAIWVPK